MEDEAPQAEKKRPGAVVWEMQLVAKEIVRETRRRPTKRQIRHQLEDEGWRIKTKDAPLAGLSDSKTRGWRISRTRLHLRTWKGFSKSHGKSAKPVLSAFPALCAKLAEILK